MYRRNRIHLAVSPQDCDEFLLIPALEGLRSNPGSAEMCHTTGPGRNHHQFLMW